MKNASMGNDMSALLRFVAKLTIFNIKHKIEEQVPHHTKNQKNTILPSHLEHDVPARNKRRE